MQCEGKAQAMRLWLAQPVRIYRARDLLVKTRKATVWVAFQLFSSMNQRLVYSLMDA